jgi:copper homeostasis protein CutC
MPGSGVRSNNILELAKFTGAGAFHSSARATAPSSMEFTNPDMNEELDSVTIDPHEVSELRRMLDAYLKGEFR